MIIMIVIIIIIIIIDINIVYCVSMIAPTPVRLP